MPIGPWRRGAKKPFNESRATRAWDNPR